MLSLSLKDISKCIWTYKSISNNLMMEHCSNKNQKIQFIKFWAKYKHKQFIFFDPLFYFILDNQFHPDDNIIFLIITKSN